jgi:hypothetical protein
MSIRERLSERFEYLMPATAVYVEFLADSSAAVAVTVASNIERLRSVGEIQEIPLLRGFVLLRTAWCGWLCCYRKHLYGLASSE